MAAGKRWNVKCWQAKSAEMCIRDSLKAYGVAEDIGIFMTLAFVSLPVIPKLRLNTYGIIDVAQQKVVPAAF